MFPPVAFDVPHLLLTVLVRDVDGGLTGAIAMKAWKIRDRVIMVKFFNFVVQIINFSYLISVVVRHGTIALWPTRLGFQRKNFFSRIWAEIDSFFPRNPA